MATQQWSTAAHPTAVGMFNHPGGGPDTCQLNPALLVEMI
jgi:hypothetical protein